ncbi:hypothetical protein BDN72DRAFT_898772 [Pluteus cervinus]|uniref:Uncharacterized protein n=1 Tax=Pluteus cervinus TaxID=181527 RepID=A0ACD3APE5_9AGAR|nr:hypothetical protein BDN72DRAFT_898772 [Pluteus cervinus]
MWYKPVVNFFEKIRLPTSPPGAGKTRKTSSSSSSTGVIPLDSKEEDNYYTDREESIVLEICAEVYYDVHNQEETSTTPPPPPSQNHFLARQDIVSTYKSSMRPRVEDPLPTLSPSPRHPLPIPSPRQSRSRSLTPTHHTTRANQSASESKRWGVICDLPSPGTMVNPFDERFEDEFGCIEGYHPESTWTTGSLGPLSHSAIISITPSHSANVSITPSHSANVSITPSSSVTHRDGLMQNNLNSMVDISFVLDEGFSSASSVAWGGGGMVRQAKEEKEETEEEQGAEEKEEEGTDREKQEKRNLVAMDGWKGILVIRRDEARGVVVSQVVDIESDLDEVGVRAQHAQQPVPSVQPTSRSVDNLQNRKLERFGKEEVDDDLEYFSEKEVESGGSGEVLLKRSTREDDDANGEGVVEAFVNGLFGRLRYRLSLREQGDPRVREHVADLEEGRNNADLGNSIRETSYDADESASDKDEAMRDTRDSSYISSYFHVSDELGHDDGEMDLMETKDILAGVNGVKDGIPTILIHSAESMSGIVEGVEETSTSQLHGVAFASTVIGTDLVTTSTSSPPPTSTSFPSTPTTNSTPSTPSSPSSPFTPISATTTTTTTSTTTPFTPSTPNAIVHLDTFTRVFSATEDLGSFLSGSSSILGGTEGKRPREHQWSLPPRVNAIVSIRQAQQDVDDGYVTPSFSEGSVYSTDSAEDLKGRLGGGECSSALERLRRLRRSITEEDEQSTSIELRSFRTHTNRRGGVVFPSGFSPNDHRESLQFTTSRRNPSPPPNVEATSTSYIVGVYKDVLIRVIPPTDGEFVPVMEYDEELLHPEWESCFEGEDDYGEETGSDEDMDVTMDDSHSDESISQPSHSSQQPSTEKVEPKEKKEAFKSLVPPFPPKTSPCIIISSYDATLEVIEEIEIALNESILPMKDTSDCTADEMGKEEFGAFLEFIRRMEGVEPRKAPIAKRSVCVVDDFAKGVLSGKGVLTTTPQKILSVKSKNAATTTGMTPWNPPGAPRANKICSGTLEEAYGSTPTIGPLRLPSPRNLNVVSKITRKTTKKSRAQVPLVSGLAKPITGSAAGSKKSLKMSSGPGSGLATESSSRSMVRSSFVANQENVGPTSTTPSVAKKGSGLVARRGTGVITTLKSKVTQPKNGRFE